MPRLRITADTKCSPLRYPVLDTPCDDGGVDPASVLCLHVFE
ncbi:hypothetical protein RRSWK_04540 [Rhodopirellula sp. SWK7]|nr:hypothetical protein RRSWK_04540 [Rhodopirellula sp. SWK7]